MQAQSQAISLDIQEKRASCCECNVTVTSTSPARASRDTPDPRLRRYMQIFSSMEVTTIYRVGNRGLKKNPGIYCNFYNKKLKVYIPLTIVGLIPGLEPAGDEKKPGEYT